MSEVDDWPHHWFGVWAEFGPAYQKCPSVHSFVKPDINAGYRKASLYKYLTTAPIVASTSRVNFPNAFTGDRVTGSISFRTDGKWLWLDDLAEYIDKYNVTIPARWLNDIEAHNYSPPKELPGNVSGSLEWPPLG